MVTGWRTLWVLLAASACGEPQAAPADPLEILREAERKLQAETHHSINIAIDAKAESEAFQGGSGPVAQVAASLELGTGRQIRCELSPQKLRASVFRSLTDKEIPDSLTVHLRSNDRSGGVWLTGESPRRFEVPLKTRESLLRFLVRGGLQRQLLRYY